MLTFCMHLCDLGVPCILQTAYPLAIDGKHEVHLISLHIWSSKGHHIDLQALSQKDGLETC